MIFDKDCHEWQCMTSRCTRSFDTIDLEESDYSFVSPCFEQPENFVKLLEIQYSIYDYPFATLCYDIEGIDCEFFEDCDTFVQKYLTVLLLLTISDYGFIGAYDENGINNLKEQAQKEDWSY
jgi:hypothetical protein